MININLLPSATKKKLRGKYDERLTFMDVVAVLFEVEMKVSPFMVLCALAAAFLLGHSFGKGK